MLAVGAVYLVCGCVLNFVVAAALAAYAVRPRPWTLGTPLVREPIERAWLFPPPEGMPPPDRAVRLPAYDPIRTRFARIERATDGSVEVYTQSRSEVGWPAPAFRSEKETVIDADGRVSRTAAFLWYPPWGTLSPNDPGRPYMPIRPNALGMIANTVLYALIPWGLMSAFAWNRRRRRRTQGRCVRCAYTLAGVSRCPECGEVVDHRAGAAS